MVPWFSLLWNSQGDIVHFPHGSPQWQELADDVSQLCTIRYALVVALSLPQHATLVWFAFKGYYDCKFDHWADAVPAWCGSGPQQRCGSLPWMLDKTLDLASDGHPSLVVADCVFLCKQKVIQVGVLTKPVRDTSDQNTPVPEARSAHLSQVALACRTDRLKARLWWMRIGSQYPIDA